MPDAHVLLNLLVHHRSQLRSLFTDDVQTRRLEGLCQLRRKSVNQRTYLTNQLGSTLKDYFPQALQLVGENLYSSMSLEFLKRWPDLMSLKACRESTIKAFYYKHNVRSHEAVEKRLELIRQAKALTNDEAVVLVSTRQVARLIRLLAEVQKHITEDEKLIHQAFKEHPDAELFRELPGAGRSGTRQLPRVRPRLGRPRRRRAQPFQQRRRRPRAGSHRLKDFHQTPAGLCRKIDWRFRAVACCVASPPR